MRRSFIFALALPGTVAILGCERNSSVTSPTGAKPGEVRTLVDLTTGLEVTAGTTGTWNYAGQSFVVPESGSFNNIRFHWYTFQRTVTAFGTLTLLTQEYLGLPGETGPSTPGFVARSERIADNVYLFAQDVTMTGGTKYWVYTEAMGSFAGSFDQDIYPAGDKYITGIHTLPFRKAQAASRLVNGVLVPAPPGAFTDANFKLQASAK